MDRSRRLAFHHVGIATFALGVAFVASGCGDDTKTSADAAVLSPKDAAGSEALAVKDAPQADTPLGTADAGIDAAAVDASIIDASQIDSTKPIDATTALDGATAIDGGAASPLCTSLVNPVFVLSGDTQVPILKQVGKVLRAQADPTTIVWVATGSCSIINTLYTGANITPNGSYIPSDPKWDASSGTVPTCTMPAGGIPADLGIPIVFPDACSTDTPPAGLGAIKGPVQSFVFVVPTASSATAISAEEAYLTFGFGQAGQVSPWINESFYFIRTATKGTQVSLGALIKVPAAKWKGQAFDKSTDVASKVATATSPDQAIGILGTEIYDSSANRAVLRTLTLQTYGQNLGYLPDSLASAFDKRSVRDGHYVGWSHVFYMTNVDATGTPTKARVKTIVDAFTGGSGAAAIGVNTVALAASNGLVPACAMTVQRSKEGGALAVATPATPCGCSFEASVGSVPAACVACTSDATCATGTHCSYGYCEAADGRTSLGDCAAPGADIPNSACTGRTTSPKRPVPTLQQQNGGVLPALP
jgi:hypothetical protein